MCGLRDSFCLVLLIGIRAKYYILLLWHIEVLKVDLINTQQEPLIQHQHYRPKQAT